MKDTFNQDPNFSIIAPGGCNAKCNFCFNKDKPRQPTQPKYYAQKLFDTLISLPAQFYQISITGNEPMISPEIGTILFACRVVMRKYTNILLTTNGTNLLDKFDIVSESVHHINVSRHHYDFSENKNIFKGSWNVTDEELEEVVDKYGSIGIDVSLNCVINDNTTPDFISSYIKYAKKIGAYAVRFRKENGNLEMTPSELHFAEKYPVLWEGKCPVCRTILRRIEGMNTFWKASVLEPSDHISDKIFEIVYDTDCNTYLDWDRKRPVLIDSEVPKCSKYSPHNNTRNSSSCGGSRNSCGGSSGSCGSGSSRC